MEKEFEKALDKSKSVPEGIAPEIMKIVMALSKKEINEWTGDQISRALSRLAVLRVNLGQDMVDTMSEYDFSYLNRKIKFASEWKPTKKKLIEKYGKATISDIENRLLEEMAEEHQRELENKYTAEQARTLYDSTGTLITALQTRLKVLEKEKTETQYY